MKLNPGAVRDAVGSCRFHRCPVCHRWEPMRFYEEQSGPLRAGSFAALGYLTTLQGHLMQQQTIVDIALVLEQHSKATRTKAAQTLYSEFLTAASDANVASQDPDTVFSFKRARAKKGEKQLQILMQQRKEQKETN